MLTLNSKLVRDVKHDLRHNFFFCPPPPPPPQVVASPKISIEVCDVMIHTHVCTNMASDSRMVEVEPSSQLIFRGEHVKQCYAVCKF